MPAKERHPSAGTSPQWRNVTPAKAGAGAGTRTSTWITAYARMTWRVCKNG